MVKLITVATDKKGYYKWLEASCKRYNVDLITLGMNQKWQGFTMKYILLINYLKTIDRNELIIFIDAYDVLLLRPLDDIEELFNNIVKITNKKIIVSMDGSNIYSLNSIDNILYKLENLYFGKCKSLSINAGTYMGRVKDILDILYEMTNDLNIDPSLDDQILMTNHCNNNKDKYYIDHNNNIFYVVTHTLTDIMKYIQLDSNNNVIVNNTKPYFIHGNANTILDNLILKLGYNITDIEIKNNYNFFYNKLVKSTIIVYPKQINYNNKKYIILIIIIIIFIILYNKYKSKLII